VVLTAPEGATPKYAGSFPQSAVSGVMFEMATPHLMGLMGPVTNNGARTWKIKCRGADAGDKAKLTETLTPSSAGLRVWVPFPKKLPTAVVV
jgi:hypothetical protein